MDAGKKPPRIGKKVRAAIELLASSKAKTYTEAAEMVGMSREHLSRSVRLPHVALAIETRTRQLLAAGTLRAGARMVELIDGPSARVGYEAARHTLAVANIRPPDQPGASINIGISPGYIISMHDPRTHQFDGAPLPEGEDRRRLLVERGLIEARALPEPIRDK